TKKYTYIWNQRVKIYKNHYRKVKKCEKSYFRPDCIFKELTLLIYNVAKNSRKLAPNNCTQI
ncbi:hypothetical protein BpHYR1_054019, partial [Brachionus plicatilis]